MVQRTVRINAPHSRGSRGNGLADRATSLLSYTRYARDYLPAREIVRPPGYDVGRGGGGRNEMTQAQHTLKVLCVRGEQDASASVSAVLSDCVDVMQVKSLNDADILLAAGDFDYVLATPASLSALEQANWVRPHVELLETVAQGVGIVDGEGELVWANPQLLRYPAEVRESVRKASAEAFAAADSARDLAADVAARRSTITSASGCVYELTATPIIDMNRQITQVVAVVWDVTRIRQRQEQFEIIDQAGRELVRLDAEQVSRLDVPARLELLEKKIVKYLHDLMHFDHFSIHVVDKKTNKLEPVLISGMPESIQNIDLFAQPEGNGISGFVAYTGQCYVCPDVSKDPKYFQGLEQARSSLTVPLRLNDEVIGVLNVESNRTNAFDDESRRLAEIFGRDIATALHILDLMVTERHTATGQIGSDVMAELTGPVNDILIDVENLIEEYIGQDELKQRLNKIAAAALEIRDSMKRVTSPQRGLRGKRPAGASRSDPILGGKRILIADDESMIRDTVKDVLNAYGCDVAVAGNGQEALDRLAAQTFDLVLSDIKMPDVSGYEVFAAAKNVNPDTPVILMTGFGYDPNHSIVRARREGLAAVLFKPFKVDQLLGELRTALRPVAS